jgi:hypothetical protein
MGRGRCRNRSNGDQERRRRHRLREVSCLYGFTRFEAAPAAADGDLEDMALAVRGAPLSQDADWLPANEQFGEGIFIHFDEEALGRWLEKSATAERHRKLLAGYAHWQRRYSAGPPPYPGTAYVLLHWNGKECGHGHRQIRRLLPGLD